MKRFTLTGVHLVCGITVTAAVSAGCTVPQPEPQPLVIGVLAAPRADGRAGEDAVRGAQLAVDVVNQSYPEMPVPLAAGTGLTGLRGSTLILADADTMASTDQAVAQATMLVNERHAVGIVVAGSAELAAATGSQMQRLRVPLVDARSTADYVTELGMDWYFRTGPDDRALAESGMGLLLRHSAGRPANQRVALLVEAGEGSTAAAAQIRTFAARAGGTVVAERVMPPSGRGTAVASQLSSAAPYAVVGWASTAAGAGAIARTAGRVAGSPALLGLGPGFRGLERPPAASAPLLRPMSWSAEFAQRSPAGQAVTALYTQRYGRPMTSAAAHAFTAVIALAVAIDASGAADPAAVRTALRQTSLPATQMIMPWDGLRFGADGQNNLAAAVVEEWVDQSFRLVYPVELAAVPPRRDPQGPGA